MTPASSPAFALLARLGGLPSVGTLPLMRGGHARRLNGAPHSSPAIERLSLPARTTLFDVGEPLDALHIVFQGSLKTVVTAACGTTRITSFVRRGEVVGFEQRRTGGHAAEAITLEPSVVLALPVSKIEASCGDDPALLHLWWRVCAAPMERHAAQLILLARRLVHERLERFLWSLVPAPTVMAEGAPRLHLAMGRGEIASYLGMTNESVSRAFAKLVDEGRIRVRGRHIDLLSCPSVPSRLAEDPAVRRA